MGAMGLAAGRWVRAGRDPASGGGSWGILGARWGPGRDNEQMRVLQKSGACAYHARFLSHRRAMSKQNQWIVGVNAVASSIENDADHVREVLVEAGSKNPRLTEIEENARRKGIDVRRVNTQALDGVGGKVRHQGVAARYAAARTWDENELEGLVEAAAGKALLLVLDGVQDPHNLGACLRSAAAAGVSSWTKVSMVAV